MSFLKNIHHKVEEFNDDAGADIGDLTGSANLSFDDIKHIRNEGGIYNSNSNLDTAPIIPTLGTFGRQAPINPNGKLNNVQYRKHMNQQKKMALLSGARANSLAAGGNPMQEGPRANSMAAGFNPMYDGMRTNSMATSYTMMPDQRYQFTQQQQKQQQQQQQQQQMGAADPRSMSMTSQRGNPMMPQQQFAMRQQQQYPVQYPQQVDQGARSMSLMGGGMPGYGQNYPRTKSLGGSRPLMGTPQGFQGQPLRSRNLVTSNPQQQMPQTAPFRNQMLPQSQSQLFLEQGMRSDGQYQPAGRYGNSDASNQMEQNYVPNELQPRPYIDQNARYMPQAQQRQQQSQPYLQQSQQHPPTQINPTDQQPSNGNVHYLNTQQGQATFNSSGHISTQQNSSEALGEVLEEEEDNLNPADEEDVIYKFGEEESRGVGLSRKSTLKKNNSMRVRKLNLFNDGEHNKVYEGKEPQSTSLQDNLKPFASKDSEVSSETPPGEKALHADVTTVEKDSASGNNSVVHLSDSHSTTLDFRKPLDLRKPLDHPSLHSIVANTVFSNFRSASSENTQSFSPHLVQTRTESPSSFYEASNSPKGKNFDSESEFHGTNRQEDGATTPPTAPTSQVSHLVDGHYDGKFDNYSNITEPIQDVSEIENRRRYSPVPDNREQPQGQSKLKPFDDDFEQPSINKSGSVSLNSIPRTFSSASQSSSSTKKEKRSSFSGKNFLKRLSRSKRSSTIEPDREIKSHQRTPSSNTIGSSVAERSISSKPLPFSKEELHIMNCNTELLNELELITRELASSIKRELALETRLKNQTVYSHSPGGEPENLESVIIDKSQVIADLQEKLNKEKRLRFISEEHALLQELGQSPSPLKLEYEKTEIYNQLVSKNDLVNQLQNRISELESQGQVDINAMDSNLIEKIQILEAENEDLMNQNYAQKEEIKILESQRDELREVIGKLTSQNNQDTKLLNDKIKALELKCQNLKGVNDRLTNRDAQPSSSSGPSFGFNRFGSRGKLNGFTIVSPNERFLEDH